MQPLLRLRWHTRFLGWLLPLMIFCAVLFSLAAFRPSLAAELGHQWHGGIIAHGQSGRINYGAALLALAAVASAFKYAWRWADSVAVSADASGLRFHRSTWRKAVPWDFIRSVRFVKDRLTGRLVIATIDGASFSIAMFDPHEGPGFATAITDRWLNRPASPSSPRAT